MTRRESREAAFLLAFSLYANSDCDAEQLLELASLAGEPESDEFSELLLKTVTDNIIEIDSLISDSLIGWAINRIPKVSLAVLRVSVAQLLYMKDISDSVVINEAVELAKKFGADDEYSFVNGALRSINEAVNGRTGEPAEIKDGEA